MNTQSIKTPHSQLFLKEFGDSKFELLLLLHGGPGTPDYLEEVATLLQDQFHVVTFDQRGTGKSLATNHSYSIQEYLDDVEAVASHFGKIAFHLFGHSWGGLLAQLFAIRNAERLKSLFLCNPVPGTGTQWASMIMEESFYILRKAKWRDVRRIISAWRIGQFGRTRSDEGWQKFYDLVWRHYFRQPHLVPALNQEWLKGIRTEPIRETVQSILTTPASSLNFPPKSMGFPIGVLYGESDFLQRSRKPVLKRFPDCDFYEIKEAGHVPWIANKEAFYKSIQTFYQKKGGPFK